MTGTFDLVSARLNRGLSRREAAAAIGVNRGILEAAESGARPHPGNAKKIADFYELRVTDIWPITDRNANVKPPPASPRARTVAARRLSRMCADIDRLLDEDRYQEAVTLNLAARKLQAVVYAPPRRRFS